MKYCVRCTGLPLAIYREVAAHLAQVEGVATELVSQPVSQFDYALSQIDSLWIEHSDDLNLACREQIQRVLAYYGDRYGRWETV